MSYRVDTIEHFEKEAKRLRKKYSFLKEEILDLIEKLEDSPFEGVPIGNGFYKIRLAIRSKGKGKRGGARVITYVKVIAETVFLVSIYDKAEQSDISQDLLQQIFEEVK